MWAVFSSQVTLARGNIMQYPILPFKPYVKRRYKTLPEDIRQKIDEALRQLAKDFSHSGLHTKAYRGNTKCFKIWQSRYSGKGRILWRLLGQSIDIEDFVSY